MTHVKSKAFTLLFFGLSMAPCLYGTESSGNEESLIQMHTTLSQYAGYLENGTYEGQDWSQFQHLPKSRFYTFSKAFEHFVQTNGKVIVELGTSRSFTHGGLPGCNQDEFHFWTPDQPQNWDWGAGHFTRMCAESLCHLSPEIHTVDLSRAHINRCRVMTEPYKNIIHYHISSSVDFLNTCPSKSIDLLYLDTGDMTPLEPTAQLQLAEAMVIVNRDLISDNGIILIDDVRNQTPKKFGESSDLGKSKYSIPYFLANGYELVEDEYQVILKKRNIN